MPDWLQDQFSEIPIWLGLIAMLVVLFFYRKLNHIERMIGILLILCAGFDHVAAAWISFAGYVTEHRFFYLSPQNGWIYNIAIIIEAAWLLQIYRKLITSQKLKRLILSLQFLFLLVSVFNLLFLQGFLNINSYTVVLAGALGGWISFLYLRQCVEQQEENPYRNFFFWFAIVTLIQNICTVPVMTLLGSYAEKHPVITDGLYIINQALYSLWFAVIIISLIWTRKHSTSFS